MNPLRTAQIKRAILDALKRAFPYAAPEISLRSHVDLLTRPPIGDEEWEELIKELVEQKAIVEVENTLDRKLKQWAITEVGRTILATL